MKTRVSAPALFLILNLLLVLIISFSLSFSAYKHHNNLSLSIHDFIVVVKSCRVKVFFIFNAIVITIFFGNSKPSTDHDPSYLSLSNPPTYQAPDDHDPCRDVKEEANEHDYVDHEYEDYSSEDGYSYHGNISDGYDEDNDDDGGDSDEDYEFYDDQENYIDLQRRSEEFIAKNNKRWIEEWRNERLLCIAAATEILTSSSS